MKVKMLIELLEEHPEDAEVKIPYDKLEFPHEGFIFGPIKNIQYCGHSNEITLEGSYES